MQTGHYFKDPLTENSTKSQYGMKHVIPAALERFHNSLDELENELVSFSRTPRAPPWLR
jgi:hypothetical protein